jgi:lipopolysaccharide export system permease protein
VFGILQRMILWELTKVFVMSLVGITGILLMAGIVAEASQQGLGPGQILTAIPLLIPSTLPYTIPATTLFATCVVYGRLAADNEVLAIRAAGVNIGKVALPGLVLGAAMSGVTMALYWEIIPLSHCKLRDMIFNDAEELLYSVLRKQRMLIHPSQPYSMYVKSVQGRKLLYPVFIHQEKGKPTPDAVAQAREAELRVDMKKKLLLIHMRFCVTVFEDGSLAQTENKTWEMPLPNNLDGKEARRPRDLSWRQIWQQRRFCLDEAEKCRAEIALHASAGLATGGPQDLQQYVQSLHQRIIVYKQQVLYLDVEVQMRPALALGCLFFILVGCPVGIWFGRSDYLSSFITCFMPIVFFYYPLMLCGTGMAKEGKWNMLLLVWSADGIIGLVGLSLLWRLIRK